MKTAIKPTGKFLKDMLKYFQGGLDNVYKKDVISESIRQERGASKDDEEKEVVSTSFKFLPNLPTLKQFAIMNKIPSSQFKDWYNQTRTKVDRKTNEVTLVPARPEFREIYIRCKEIQEVCLWQNSFSGIGKDGFGKFLLTNLYPGDYTDDSSITVKGSKDEPLQIAYKLDKEYEEMTPEEQDQALLMIIRKK